MGRPLSRRFFACLAFGLVGLISVGCEAEATTAGQGGADMPAVCDGLQDLSRATTKAQTLNGFSSPGDVKIVSAAVDVAFARVQASAVEAKVDVSALKAEVEKFDAFATRVPPGLTVGRSAAAISGQATVVAKEQAKVAEAAGCTASS
jgi:hypothetical protein